MEVSTSSSHRGDGRISGTRDVVNDEDSLVGSSVVDGQTTSA